jgi:hypothetical protein
VGFPSSSSLFPPPIGGRGSAVDLGVKIPEIIMPPVEIKFLVCLLNLKEKKKKVRNTHKRGSSE